MFICGIEEEISMVACFAYVGLPTLTCVQLFALLVRLAIFHLAANYAY